MAGSSEIVSSLNELIQNGHYLKAVDIACEQLEQTGDDAIRKPYALGLSRMGHVKQALEVLSPLTESGIPDPEKEGLIGGILKRQWETTGDSEVLKWSYRHYLKSFRMEKNYWAGVNAATLASVLADEKAEELTDEVLEICWDEYGKMGTRSSFWLLVSIAECHLLKKDIATALKWYKLVGPMTHKSVGRLKSVRRNARILGQTLSEENREKLMAAIPAPTIAFFAGHRIDREGMPVRFPQVESETVKRKLKIKLGKMRISVGVASLADGADILFHECLIETGRQNRVILPYPLKEFRERLAADDPGGWLERFDSVIEQSSTVETVSRSVFTKDWSIVHELATDYMLGYSLNLAEEFDAQMLPLVVWDGESRNRAGGTYSAVKKLRKLGYEPEKITVFPKRKLQNSSVVEDEDEYRDYVPSRNIIVVAGIGKDIRSDDGIADELSRYIRFITDMAISKREAPVKKTLSGSNICMFFREMIPAMNFIRRFSEENPDSCLSVHAGLSLRFETSLSQTGDTFSPALIEAVELNRKLSAGQVFATITFRSLAYLEDESDFRFVYRGVFEPDHTSIKIFEMIPESRR